MDQYRVFGNPIAQSKSPFIHQKFAQQTKQVLNYESELVPLDNFKIAIRNFIANNGRGANITAPFKEQAFNICDHLSKRAELAGAVNTLVIENGLVYGDNTDGMGLVNDLQRNNIQLEGSRILLLGAGGAAKGVMQALLEQLPSQLIIANRTLSKAELIVELYPGKPVKALNFSDTENMTFDIIINATSAGLSGAKLPISNTCLKKSSTCYDMVYGKELTPFLKQATTLGVDHVIDGLGMLVGQAAESFELWRKVKPKTAGVLSLLRTELKHVNI